VLKTEFRRRVLEEAVASGMPGLVTTCVWRLDVPEDAAEVEALASPVLRAGGRVDVVELWASQATRLAREGTELRLEHKRSKRDVDATRRRLLEDDAEHQLSTNGDFVYADQHLRLDNSRLTAARRQSASLNPSGSTPERERERQDTEQFAGLAETTSSAHPR